MKTMNPKPTKEGFLPEQDGHKVYYAQYGNPKGPAIVSCHGGPGSKSKSKHVNYFDLEKYQVIVFDQRGCGESTPAGEIAGNNTQTLISDMERLRKEIGVAKWFVSGSSWGSTLALAYAQEHPDRVFGLLLGSVFLAKPTDIEWSFQKPGGIERAFPDVWEERLKFLEKYSVTPENAAKVLLQKLLQEDEETAKDIAAGVLNWEGNLFSLQDDTKYITADDVSEDDIIMSKIFLHYEANNFFIKQDQIVNNLVKIEHIPAMIVHGRYDMLCPIDAAWAIKKKLKRADLVVMPSSAHKLTAEAEVAKGLAFRGTLERWTA